MNKQSVELVRLRRVILNDTLKIPNGVVEILKNDLLNVLGSYFDIERETLKIEITVGEDGIYNLSVNAQGSNAKTVKNL